MMVNAALFEKIAILGAGMIGSSVAQSVRLSKVVNSIAMADCSESVIKEAKALNLADSYTLDLAEAVVGADLVFLCMPVGAMGDAVKLIAPYLRAGCVLTDVGSVKEDVVKALEPLVGGDVHLIPGHPVAGTEKSGPSAGIIDLFKGRWCILTPPASADPSAVEKLTQFWQAIGSKVEIMDAAHHDRVLAITSHVPHLIAFNIVGTASDLEQVTRSEVIKYSAGGFRDFTRIAASDPVMWRDVFLSNKDAVLEMLGRFSEDLTALQRAIRWGDGDALEELFTRTRDIRNRIIDAGQDDDTVDFGRHHKDE